jgi:hypothetical protein|tara:strand:+ start:712 stop:825 length:114 start_codon:yes stop_codon:yes gene_type:complete
MEKLVYGFLKGILGLQFAMLGYAVCFIAYKTVETLML